nr:MAG TPA: hypothetical protein [Caudoviricetes sp.]
MWNYYNLRILELVMNEYQIGEEFTNQDVKRIIKRNNAWLDAGERVPKAYERCIDWCGEHGIEDANLSWEMECCTVLRDNVVVHYEPNQLKLDALPTGKSFSDRFKGEPWLTIHEKRVLISEKTIEYQEYISSPQEGTHTYQRPFFDEADLCDGDIVIEQPFYGKRYFMTLNDSVFGAYESAFNEYKGMTHKYIMNDIAALLKDYHVSQEELVGLLLDCENTVNDNEE